jgi:protein-tyrosine-phosphatase
MNILFVCKGNVARSQMAEALLKEVKPEYDVFSAGIQENTPKKYVYPSREVVQVMSEMGIDVSSQKVKTINQNFVSKADKIIYMCNPSELPSYLQDSPKLTYWRVVDPCETGLDTFRKVRDEIKHLIQVNFL